MTITEFLEARLSEDEAVARGSIGMRWDGDAFQQVRTHCGDDPHYYKIASGQVDLEHWEQAKRLDPGTTFQHIARHDPARVLAECAAKRAIIEFYDKTEGHTMAACGEWTFFFLAAVYKDHPDYEPGWDL